ncbi:hypothetical protein SAMN05216412_101203 [Nitrosospira multiformis]|uniref:Uncharacterized protein n=1 Tax=Nitrosospira multiformis TaxID=1231 RepID=A0A1H9YGZ0_9PROT|nr:hypothetical protein SAMN05216412_101203 [Nitrosospira multiformis]
MKIVARNALMGRTESLGMMLAELALPGNIA